MKSEIALTSFLAAVSCMTAQADFSQVLDGGWRISAGGVYDRGVKAKARFAPPVSYTSPHAPGGRTKEDARAAVQGTKTSETRTEFPNGAWIDTADPVYEGGDDFGRTRFYSFPMSSRVGESFTLASASYDEVTSVAGNPASIYGSDETGAWGFNIELSRNLYHDEDYGWGVDAAFAFQYFHQDGLFKASSSWLNGSSVRRTGTLTSRIDLSGDYDSWNEHGDYYGAGGYEGNAGPIDGSSLVIDEVEKTERDSSRGSLNAEGDYENLEMMLLARPYYDFFDWLRVNATVGAVVSRQSMDFSFTMFRDGQADYRSSHDYSQWDVYGVAGLGMMLYYEDFTVSADFLARFFDRDMDINDRYCHGSVSRGDWMIRVSLGYEF